jgi:uncharacterized damage-inducible protein DinB
MVTVESLLPLFQYNDWADKQLLTTAARCDDAALDRTFDMGPGSLRRTLIHLYNGEFVWLQRWQGKRETKWPSETEKVAPQALLERFEATWRERDAFLRSLSGVDLGRVVVYRDSKGSEFQAALSDMLLQMLVHSTHHRAQAVNMLRQIGAGLVELDYMMAIRRPVPTLAGG